MSNNMKYFYRLLFQCMNFLDNVKRQEYCSVKLNEVSYKAFVYAVKNQYWYQMYIDNLPIWGMFFYLCYFNQLYSNRYILRIKNTFHLSFN